MFDVSRRACRAVLFDKLDTAKMHGLDTPNVSCRDVTSQVEFGLQSATVSITIKNTRRQGNKRGYSQQLHSLRSSDMQTWTDWGWETNEWQDGQYFRGQKFKALYRSSNKPFQTYCTRKVQWR